MADSTHVSVACPPHQREPSLPLISPNTNNMPCQNLEDDCGRDKDSSLKPPRHEIDGDQCNGPLHIEDNPNFTETTKVNQNCSSSGSMDDLQVHTHASVRYPVGKTKCFEKVNGLTHSEHSSGDNKLLVQLLNTCCNEEGESDTHSHSDDSGQGSGKVYQCIETDCDIPHDESGLTEKCSPEVHCDADHNSVDVLLSELEKVSINQLSNCSEHCTTSSDVINGITYVVYESEKQMPDIMRLITKDLSEPYSIYTYRYFIHNWPKLCFLAMVDKKCVGAIVCKLDLHKKMVRRGYIAMLAVDSEYRRRQIVTALLPGIEALLDGMPVARLLSLHQEQLAPAEHVNKPVWSTLVTKAIEAMIRDDCDEVVLETEITNQGALRLYENLGFVRDKRLFRYYLNGVDALRLKLWLR